MRKLCSTCEPSAYQNLNLNSYNPLAYRQTSMHKRSCTTTNRELRGKQTARHITDSRESSSRKSKICEIRRWEHHIFDNSLDTTVLIFSLYFHLRLHKLRCWTYDWRASRRALQKPDFASFIVNIWNNRLWLFLWSQWIPSFCSFNRNSGPEVLLLSPRMPLLQLYHYSLQAGHQPECSTYDPMRHQVYWSHMASDL